MNQTHPPAPAATGRGGAIPPRRRARAGNGTPRPQRRQPGRQSRMDSPPVSIRASYRGSGKLAGRTALISGGDSGIGRAVALHYAREGCDVAIVYLDEHEDAAATQRLVEAEARRCVLIAGDAREETFCRDAVRRAVQKLGRLDILVNNLGAQFPQEELEQITRSQLEKTFATNVYPCFALTRYALEHLPEGGCIVNCGSVTSFRGHKQLIDYSATKGAIESFTYSLAQNLAGRGIRVNGVAPGPIWTPLIVASFRGKDLREFGKSTLMKRAGQPAEVGPAFVFLASDDASFITGQFIHVNGGGFIG